MVLALGFLCAFMGITFLVGCFRRVDSPSFIVRAGGDEAKIAKLHSLQEAWDRLGKARQFVASSSGCLIMAAGMLLMWFDATTAKHFWAVPALFALNLVALLQVQKHANAVLNPDLVGHSDVLGVIRLNIRMCITFSIVFVLFAVSLARNG